MSPRTSNPVSNPQPLAPNQQPPSFPRRGYFSSSAPQPRQSSLAQQQSQKTPYPIPTQTLPSNSPAPAFSPPSNSLLSRAPTTSTTPLPTTPLPNTPQWQAARESVLSSMVGTAADFPPPTTPSSETQTPSRGKARGGRARIGRPPKIKPEPVESPAGLTPDFAGSAGGGRGSGRGRGRSNRGGRPRGSRAGRGGSRAGAVIGKRKRRSANRDEDEEEEAGVKEGDGSEDEVYAPLPTQSRSGRRITQVQTPGAAGAEVIDLEDGDSKKKDVKSKTTVTPITAKTPRGAPTSTRKPKPTRRKPGEAAVCKNCGRGHSPAANVIVFCDGCNTPWHQYCHNPPIADEVVKIEDKEWLCGDCGLLRSEKGVWEGRVPVGVWALSEKRRYLESVGVERLVSLVLQASSRDPELPIFGLPDPVTRGEEEERGGEEGDTSAAERKDEGEAVPMDLKARAEEELSDILAERELLPYPKAGHGIVLPKKLDELAFALDEDISVYSHRGCGWSEEELFGGKGYDPAAFEIGVGA